MNTVDDLRSALRHHEMFAALDERAFDSLFRQSAVEKFRRGDVLLSQGTKSDFALLLVEGLVEIIVQTTQGPVLLTELSPVALLGDIGVFAGLPRTATVRGRTEGRVLRLDGSALADLGGEEPSVLRYVIGQLGRRIHAFNQATGFYTNALAALDTPEPDSRLLDNLINPPAELVNFALTFRRLAEHIVHRKDQRREMASAAAIQRMMLPDPLPDDAPGRRAELCATMRPARDVGGDFYDAFAIDAHQIALSIGDVAGKGVPAALFMAVCQTTMRLVLRQEDDLARALARANDLLDADNRESMFATIFAGVLDLRSGRFTYCNGGHPPPLVLRTDGSREALTGTGPPVALASPAEFRSRTLHLAPGDQLFLYTDGIAEAQDGAAAFFGDARLAQAIEGARGRGADGLVQGVLEAMDEFVGDAPQFDDVTCLALSYKGDSVARRNG